MRGVPRLLGAGHGSAGEEQHRILFDVGPYGDVWLDNAERLGVDLASIAEVFLSHWHWDHSGALPAVVAAIAAARAAAGTHLWSSTSTRTAPTNAA